MRTPSREADGPRGRNIARLAPLAIAKALAKTIVEVQRFVASFESHDPVMAFAEIELGGKKMTVEDLLAEVITAVKLRSKLRVSGEQFFVHGEESLAIRRTAKDLTAEVRLGSLHDAIDGTDLRGLHFGNDCSAAIVVDPTKRPGARILAAVIGIPQEAVFYATQESSGVWCWKVRNQRLASSGPNRVPERVNSPARLGDAVICCYGQKPTSLVALYETGFFGKWTSQPGTISGRYHGLAGMPMVPRMIAPGEGAKPVDVMLEVAGQAPHDMAAGAYIALKAGATILHLDGRPFSVEDVEEAVLHPANERFRMRYVMAATKELADEAIEWLHLRPLETVASGL